jgi:hypothetical protein
MNVLADPAQLATLADTAQALASRLSPVAERIRGQPGGPERWAAETLAAEQGQKRMQRMQTLTTWAVVAIVLPLVALVAWALW